MHPDIITLFSAVQDLPGLAEPLDEMPEFLYGHLSQCILSAVFSLGNYRTSELRTVQQYVQYSGLYPEYRPGRQLYLPTHQQQPLETFIEHIEAFGPPVFAQAILHNRQRTSTIAGVLKADACFAFAQVLQAVGVRYLQDVELVMDDKDFEKAIRGIPGQGSRISLVQPRRNCPGV